MKTFDITFKAVAQQSKHICIMDKKHMTSVIALKKTFHEIMKKSACA